MLTKDDIKNFEKPAKVLLESLRQFDLRVKRFHEHPSNNNNAPQALSGLIGLTASHLKSIIEFPQASADKTAMTLNGMERNAAINISLPFTLEKMLPLIERFRLLEQKPPIPEGYNSITEVILKNIEEIKKPLEELKARAKSKGA